MAESLCNDCFYKDNCPELFNLKDGRDSVRFIDDDPEEGVSECESFAEIGEEE